MVGLPDGKKNFEDIYNRVDSILACDRQTDGQTDIHLATASPRYAYASRGKNRTVFAEVYAQMKKGPFFYSQSIVFL